MPVYSIGDMARHYSATRANIQIRDRLNTLNEELVSGKVKDLPAYLNSDQGRLADVERRLTLTTGYTSATKELGQTLNAMQIVLGNMDEQRGNLANQLVQITGDSSPAERLSAADAARGFFSEIVSAYNGRYGDTALFSGAATDQPALADADALLADLRTAIGTAVAAEDVIDAIDFWFDDPAGGFATMGYLGDTGDLMQRSIDTGLTVTINARADQPAMKDLLRAAAIGAIAEDTSLPFPVDTDAQLLRTAGLNLMTAASSFTELRGSIGLAEERTEIALARHTARSTAYGMMRNDLTLADPYETATTLKAVQAQLETHYTLTARMAQLSLTSFLR